MHRLVVLTCMVLGLASVWVTQAGAAGNSGSRQHEVNWNQRDTAVYVVSTLNLVRTTSGRPFAQVAMGQLDVTHFDVYADLDHANLYFIQLKRDDDSTAAVLAYQMGWLKPQTVTRMNRQFRLRQVSWSISQAYRVDTKEFMASFTSTFPR